jgi:hypothetical protein
MVIKSHNQLKHNNMAGCFGSHPYDRMVERELDAYLSGFDDDNDDDDRDYEGEYDEERFNEEL